MVLDGEIAAPDDRGVTHIDGLNDALLERRPDRLAYFAFDLLHFDGHDLRRCPIEDRKTLLRDIIGVGQVRTHRLCRPPPRDRRPTGCRLTGIGRQLFEAVRQVGAEGVVSKRRGSIYRGGESRDWLKTKCHETGVFAITGFSELGEGRLGAVYVAEERGGVLLPAGQVRFGFAGQGLWHTLDRLRTAPPQKGFVPVQLGLIAKVKFFGRYKAEYIRDGVLLSVSEAAP